MSNSSNDEVLIIEEAPSPETTNTAVALRSAKTQLTSRFLLTVDRLFKRGRDSAKRNQQQGATATRRSLKPMEKQKNLSPTKDGDCGKRTERGGVCPKTVNNCY